MQQRELRRSKRDHQWKPRHVMRQSSAPAFPDPLFKEQWYLVRFVLIIGTINVVLHLNSYWLLI